MTNATQTQKKPAALGWILPVIIAATVKFKSFLWLGGSLLTMFLSIWVFAQRDGLPYGVALVFLILIHESGHWIWMKALGLNPKAPMFIPGLGAFVAMTKVPASEALHAWIAMAGPLIGGLGCAVLYAIGVHTNNNWLMSSSNTGFMLNLLQLMPAKPLDGGFIVQAVSKWLLVPGTLGLLLLAMSTGSSLLYLITIFSFLSFWQKKAVVAPTATTDPVTGVVTEQPATVTALATGWERLTVGLAYICLIGALAGGFLLSYSDIN